MVAGNMKIITLNTNVSTVKNQHLSNNVVKASSPNSMNKANVSQQTPGSNTNESPKMRYFNGTSIYNHNDSAKSLQTPKQCNSNNKNGKKSQSHMFYNIPTTSVLNRKKYYQQHHRHNQHQHNFVNNSKEIRNNIPIKNHNMLESDPSNPIEVHLACVQKQNIPKVDNSKVEDFVNNNTATLNVNNICIQQIPDDNCDGTTVDNSIALSSHRAKSEFKQHAPSTDNFPVSTPADKHNCVGENKSINLDCNSCWTNLVAPQCTESPASLSWPWVHISRRKSSSISSTSSYSSSVSSALSISAESNPELQQSISVTYANNSYTSKKKSFRKGNTSNNRGNIDTRYSSPRVKGQRQRRATNVSNTTDEVPLITESQRKIHPAEDPTAMSTALATNTVSATATTTSTVDSKVEITIAAENASGLVKSTSNVVTLTVTSPSLSSPQEITNIDEFASLPVLPAAPQPSGESTNSSVTLTTPSGSPTASTPGSSPSNSYSLDFLHSVGVQMTGGANLSALCKNNTNNSRTITPFNNQNTSVVSPVRTAYSYQNILPQRSHPMHGRYTPNSGGIGVGNSGNHMRDQRAHRFQHSHHHHHPQQLTIASFMQKELLNENVLAGSNRCDISDNGPEDSDGVDVNNNNAEYTNQHSYRNHQRFHNYYQSHYQQSQQHRLSGMQQGYVTLHPSYNREVENEGGSRVSRSGSYAYSQHVKRNNTFQNHQNNGEATSNSVQSLPVHKHSVEDIDGENVSASNNAKGNNANNNSWSSKQFHQKLLSSKKSNSGSNVSYSCSSSSSVSSNSSQASTSSYRQQKVKSSTQMNLIIETLPRKVNTSTHRGNHRLQQVNYHNQQYTSAAGGSQSSTAQQTHQNIHNLTYVNTEGLTTISSVGMGSTGPSRSCSPSLPPPVASTSGGQCQDAVSSVVLSYTPNHFQPQQQHQQSFISGKRLTPFALNVPSTNVHSTSPHPVGNMICYAQLNDSVTSSDSNQVPSAVQGAKIRDYDDSDSSSTNSAVQSQRRNKYQQAKSISLSSSSSTSSTSSSTTRNFNGPVPALSIVAMPHLQSPEPTEFGYNPTFSSTSQHYAPQAQPLASPQQQSPFRTNGVISMLNVPFANNYPEDDLNSMKQHSLKHQGIHPQQRHFYFASGEHLNATPLSAHVANAGYWSPLQHSSFIYPQPANFLASAPCLTPTATLSPGFSEQDDHHFHIPHNQQQLNIVNQTEGLPPAGQIKRSLTPQMGGAIMTQQPHQRLAQSTASQGGMVTTTTNVAALRQRNVGRNSQQQTLHHHQQITAPPPTPISHVYPQHNLLFGGPTTHIRTSSNTAHEFFTHTPPDRFLARAHLIEAKEAPCSLLNNSKWDNLSQGVWNKFINSQQTEETFKQKMRLWRYLYIIIKNTYPRFGLYLVGSTISGFGADTSDVDMCLVSRSTSNVEPRMEALFNLTVLRDYLSKSAEFENFNLIEAKVPILRFRDRIHQLEVDLNFNNCVGIKNTHLLYCYSQLDWRLRPMVLVTKLWAQYHNINNAKNMTISSYSLVLMVIHFLQYAVSPAVLPCLHDLFPDKFPLLRSNDFGYVDMNETIGPYESKNTQTIGELFLYFLEYYSCFDYTQFAISIRTGGLLPINVCRLAKSSKNDIHQWKELCIEEPFDLTNTARSVYDFETFERVKAVFVASWRILQQTLDLNSIFAPIIVPPTNNIVSTLRHTGFQFDECHNIAPSDVSTTDSNTINMNANGSTTLLSSDNSSNMSPAISVASLPIETNNNDPITKEIFNNANGNSKSTGGSLTELVS
ncbi:poly(A) RNA polymerase gld-2 homolog B [Bactrocera dorsalis]|uniref:Poly(A) RNA polymerase gld-2 homolog B n=2 Tax=Bactrocera dorsalis TaxID=27457 RepID=A0ABM3JP29_BACDO|nr:poly(A) RNA polymerase gld-2 homolog B [Bactrocera dorsalis]XP_049310983.1 poly(A) RNA polymerase gld-2 homolog B [Bactrocera dorsalis]XP_049310984.1 poly(A) RNA polymerase gld-2 homolog B [Bactrocera dorsalis]XP_049310985.1 poly(A) RNA polymerase gld-2 homolog B [Bactrocera dorsalis]